MGIDGTLWHVPAWHDGTLWHDGVRRRDDVTSRIARVDQGSKTLTANHYWQQCFQQARRTSGRHHLKSRVARLAILRPNFSNLAVFQVGWPYDFWVGRLDFFGRFLKVVWPKIFSVRCFQKYIYILRRNRQRQQLFWKSRSLCVRFALCIEL